MPRRLLRTVAVSITVTVCWTIVWREEGAETAKTTCICKGCSDVTGSSTSVAVCERPQAKGPEYTDERL